MTGPSGLLLATAMAGAATPESAIAILEQVAVRPPIHIVRDADRSIRTFVLC